MQAFLMESSDFQHAILAAVFIIAVFVNMCVTSFFWYGNRYAFFLDSNVFRQSSSVTV